MLPLEDRSTLSLIWQILQRRDKFRLGFALILILISALLEMVSLSLVIPIVQAVVSGDKRSDYSWLPAAFSEWSYDAFVQFLMLLVVGAFVAKNSLLLSAGHYQQRLQYAITSRIYQRLFSQYLSQPLEFHLLHSSSLLVRNVQEYSGAVVNFGVAPILVIAAETVTGLCLLTLLVIVEPRATALILCLFLVVSLGLVVISRTKSRSWGEERTFHRGLVLQSMVSGFGGIREIKLFGRDSEVLAAHRRNLRLQARASYKFAFVQMIPSVILELAAIVGLALLILTATLRDVDAEGTTTVLALVAVVGFRMLPSASKLVQAAQKLSFGRAAVEGSVSSLAMQVSEKLPYSDKARDQFVQLQVTAVKYRYPNTEFFVTDIDNMTLRAGESLGIVGASGSGKSTLVDLLIGILTPTSGHITVNDRRLDEDPRYWQDRIGYVPQHVYLMDTSVRQNVAFGLPEKVIDATEVERALRLANLWDFVQTLPQGLDTVVGERGVRLSGGQRQRLGIARALYGNPEVIVLDEATSALDEDTEREIVESMREISRDRTLIVVAHRTSTLAHCSRLIRLEAGRIVQEGSFEEVIGSLPNA